MVHVLVPVAPTITLGTDQEYRKLIMMFDSLITTINELTISPGDSYPPLLF